MTQAPAQWLGDSEGKPAPQPLARIQALVNTVDLESGADRLAHAVDAEPWLRAQGLLPPGTAASTDDLVFIRDVREALRAMLVHNAGGPAPTGVQLGSLNRIADAAAARVRLGPGGTLRVAADTDSLEGRLLSLLLVVADAQRDGTWTHLKACGNEDCRWAFYDRSRNHGGTWCDMATCGNKLKNREFRARRRG
ncbi:CGNR zinc finger domain-containing protein [Mycobacterium sp. CVI_P3]|uniref:CGNR zinc finger domain-containing protein n=1 Tax=Mycobacterium pinniadriaticum TaxID=2994102 RepID=A0ABT3S991_9MYCO|nr:CGNR zinc finger domain-containing protein [Mycobacterium pinniadriaticum]MCX2929639.1 CGNR zinc finger domain-containing protein [Mycobacterium pinniadriaticum]MCX2936063.1 CGNR zinc finger domain-containing protein [Mycobacterium pinniadriaticum]